MLKDELYGVISKNTEIFKTIHEYGLRYSQEYINYEIGETSRCRTDQNL
jgi:hypothetical protein